MVAVRYICLITSIIITWGCCPWNSTNTTADIYLWKTAIKTVKQNVKFVQTKLINRCSRTIVSRLARVFLKKPWTHFTFYLGVTFLTLKCWLEKASLTFSQIKPWCQPEHIKLYINSRSLKILLWRVYIKFFINYWVLSILTIVFFP